MEPVDNANEGKRGLDWSKELHYKFLDVVNILGGIRGKDTVPNNILKLMNEPGLTRAQVASHLQKYRKNKEDGWERRNKLVRHNEQYEKLIQQSYQLDASSSSSSSYRSNDGVFSYEPDESMLSFMLNQLCSWNAMQRNNDQTWVPFVENGNLQVEGSSYPMMSQLDGAYIIPKNEDNNSPYSAQSMGQEIATQMPFVGDAQNYNNNYYYPNYCNSFTFKDSSVGQDDSGGNHIMVDHSLLPGENHNSSSYHSYSAQVGQQQFPVPLLSDTDIYSNLEQIIELPTCNDNEQDCSGGNHMPHFFNNFDSQINIDQWPSTYSANWQYNEL